jgi:hypothetical protein
MPKGDCTHISSAQVRDLYLKGDEIMKLAGSKTIPPQKLLGLLAMEFRSTRDDKVRTEIAKSYSVAVDQLINAGRWREIPSLEDQLPDEWMPNAFFKFWKLNPPTRHVERKG